MLERLTCFGIVSILENLYLVKFRLPHHCYDINMSIFSCMSSYIDILTVIQTILYRLSVEHVAHQTKDGR